MSKIKSFYSFQIEIFISQSEFIILYPNEAVVKIFISYMKENPKIYVYHLFLAAYMKTFDVDTIVTDDEGFNEIIGIEVINPYS